MTETPPTSQLSITEAHRVSGRSKTTLRRHISKGKLSCTIDEDGRRWVDSAELARAYGLTLEDFERQKQPPSEGEEGSGSNRTAPDHRVESVQQQLDTLTKERERERQQFEAQIDQLQETLRLAQEGHNRATLLLENQQSRGGGWEEAIAAIERRLANQEIEAMQERDRLKKQIAKYKGFLNERQQELEEERQKTVWQKLFG